MWEHEASELSLGWSLEAYWFGDEMISVVSSAYVYTVDLFSVLMRSLVYRRKKVVKSVLPCGMPCVDDCLFLK